MTDIAKLAERSFPIIDNLVLCAIAAWLLATIFVIGYAILGQYLVARDRETFRAQEPQS